MSEINLVQRVARSLDEPARILGVTPLEWVACAVFYAAASMLLQGVPFGALLSLVIAFISGATVFILNRSFPPHHGLHAVLSHLRPRIFAVMAADTGGNS